MKQTTGKIRVLIVDDEPIARRGIRANLSSESDVEIVGECANGREAVAAIRRRAPDLVFLDVQMPLMDGFGVVAAIGAERMPAVVFVTAFDEHAIRAFEINAVDYLLKPVDPERFRKTLLRVRRELANAGAGEELDRKISRLLENRAETVFLERLAVKTAGRIIFLKTDEISRISSEGNYVKIHAGGKTHLLRETMDALQRKLDPHKFIRLRRSAIVRIELIRELHPLFNGEFVVTLEDGAQITSSRRYRHNLDQLLKN